MESGRAILFAATKRVTLTTFKVDLALSSTKKVVFFGRPSPPLGVVAFGAAVFRRIFHIQTVAQAVSLDGVTVALNGSVGGSLGFMRLGVR